MKELLSQGGPLMWVLLACCVLGIGIFLERFFHFHRSSIVVQDLVNGLGNLVGRKNYAEALHICAGTPGPVARVMRSLLMRHEAPREELKEIAQEAGQLEVPRLERYLPVLLAVSYIAPLIGLLGTSLAMADTMLPSAGNRIATQLELAQGLHKSLIATATGLAVAIGSYIGYAYLQVHVKNLMHDMERAGIEMVNLLMQSRQNKEIVEFKEGARAVEEKRRKAGPGPRA